MSSGMATSHGDASHLHHDSEHTADALREGVLDDRLILDERERPAGGLCNDLHRRRVMVVAETKVWMGAEPSLALPLSSTKDGGTSTSYTALRRTRRRGML